MFRVLTVCCIGSQLWRLEKEVKYTIGFRLITEECSYKYYWKYVKK